MKKNKPLHMTNSISPPIDLINDKPNNVSRGGKISRSFMLTRKVWIEL